MRITHGKVLIFFGIIHPLFGVSLFAFGKQFTEFSKKLFFNVSEGLLEFPLLNGQMNYENFAAFWFFYFGLLLIPLGVLVDYIETVHKVLPKKFVVAYLTVVLVGAFMIPFSGMTLLMLPHALYMLFGGSHDKRAAVKLN